MILQPEDLANRALDLLGSHATIGDLQEGTTEARAMLRAYVPAMQELLRGVHWNFARKQAPMTLLQDASGLQSNAFIGTGTPGMGQFLYEYDYPIDCMQARFLPLNWVTPSSTPTPPLTTAGNAFPNWFNPVTPAPFLITNDAIPGLIGGITNWNQLPDFGNAQGHGIKSRVVVLTNVKDAQLVYTARIDEPNVWDPSFQQALAALLASRTATAIIKDPKEAMAKQNAAIGIAKSTIADARQSNGNEGQSSVNREASWITARGAGSVGWTFNGPGVLFNNWAAVSFADGSVY